ncbi:MAG: hypothetical protein ACQET3_08715 [Promethearchaeati archaeon]
MMHSVSYRRKVCQNTWYDKRRDLFFAGERPPTILDRPLSLSIRVGRYCNLICKVCLSDSGPDRVLKSFSFGQVLKALSELRPLRIVWTGGEPLLYSIIDDLEHSISLDNFNIITTNLTTTNLPREIGLEVFWDVSLYGWDRQSYAAFTGKDVFRRIERNLHGLFDAGFAVGISIRIDLDWPRYLPHMVEYISRLPIRKLLLLNTILVGRSTAGIHPVTAESYEKLKSSIRSAQLSFPTILPCVPADSDDPREGYLLIEKGLGSMHKFLVNGVPCSGVPQVVQEILNKGRANFRLFTLQEYCVPSGPPS